MTPGPARRDSSFGHRLLLMVAVHAGGVALALLVLLLLHARMEGRRDVATQAFVEEQLIADGLTTAVMRQLAAATAFQKSRDEMLLADFRGSGEEASRLVRRYLFHDLSPAQRRQLEEVKEAHQRLEVAAARALDLTRRGLDAQAANAAAAMAGYGLELQSAMSRFLQMRHGTLEEVRRRSAASLRLVYVGGGVFALLTILGTVLWARFLRRRLARPLDALAEAAARIRDGDLSARVPVPEDRELAAVASSFNQMSRGLAGAMAAEEARTAELEHALARLRDTQAELVQSEKLSAMGRMMAGLAHELNNPLATVLGYSQLLREQLDAGSGSPGDQELRELVEPIVSEAGRARDLVQDLLSFTREPRGSVSSVRIAEVVRAVARLRGGALEAVGIDLDADAGPEDLGVAGDAQRVEQALINLVDNARDALLGQPSNEGVPVGTIRIRVVPRESEVDVVVEDDGPGWADVERAFEPFYTTKPVGQGTGLGLALVHGFMEECGGRARAEDRPDGGARVTLSFRTAPAPESEETPSGPDARAARGTGVEQSLRVLVVEDEAPLRALQKRLLQRVGASVEVAEGGRDARRILDRGDFDVVVSDVKMPDGGGLDLYRWATEERPDLVDRFLFVTGDVGDPEVVELARQKPERFLNKPFHVDAYLRRVVATAESGAG